MNSEVFRGTQNKMSKITHNKINVFKALTAEFLLYDVK